MRGSAATEADATVALRKERREERIEHLARGNFEVIAQIEGRCRILTWRRPLRDKQECLRYPVGGQFSAAARRRRTTRSWPSATIVSKSGGATAWPTIATRMALINKPAFTPPASATARLA